MNSISYENIIAQSGLSSTGVFEFKTNFFPEGDHLYRIHLSKNNDPPASLIIGGNDHNHIFLIAGRNSKVEIETLPGNRLFNDLIIVGYDPNKGLQEVKAITAILDSLDYEGFSVNREFIRNATYNELRKYADTSSNSLVAIYAIYQTDFKVDYLKNEGYYKTVLKKWRSEKSDYYNVFRKQLYERSNLGWVVIFIIGSGVVILVNLLLYSRKIKRRLSPLTELTIQERKVFLLLKEGKSNKEIAEECAVSVSTVKSHVNSIFSKLRINSRKEIINV